MESSTKILRRMLDERGVEWTYEDGVVSYASGGHWRRAWAYSNNAMCVSMGYLTPELAIAATLGAGTCHVECFDDGIDEALDGSPIYTTPTWHLSCGHTEQGSERPNFCPVCGKAVVA